MANRKNLHQHQQRDQLIYVPKLFTEAILLYLLSRSMTILDVAKHLNISWDVVKDIQKRNLNKHFAKPKLKHLTRLAIDEITDR